ncbi:MAG: cysteine synthase A [Lentisphaeria bacterium]
MSHVLNSILEAVGNTPLVRLQRLVPPNSADILVKVEGLNVGGSIKTRTAFAMIENAEKSGILKPGSVVIEPTSGNQGIGLALICALKRYRCIIVMPDSVSIERRCIVQLYGAETVLVEDRGDIGEAMRNCMAKAAELQKSIPNSYIPQQFSNPSNPKVHHDKTGREILEQLGEIKIDGFCSGVGTGGTLTGIGRLLREHFPDVRIVAVEPENAAVLAGGAVGSHLQMGIGDGFIPDNLDQSLLDCAITVSDEEAMKVARSLASQEGLPAGISSGSNVAGALRLAKKLGAGKTVLTVLPDSYDRYYSTPLFS